MTAVYDQFEIEPPQMYSGSYTDGKFSFGSIFTNTRRVIASNAVPADTNTMPMGLTASMETIVYNAINTTVIDRIQTVFFGPNLPQNSASLIARENILSPSQNTVLKTFTPNEQFYDTILPSPVDIYITNGGQPIIGNADYDGPYAFRTTTTDQYNEDGILGLQSLSLSRTNNIFKIVLGSHEAQLTNSSDSSMVSDNTWAYSFPFETKYATLSRFTSPIFNKSFDVTLVQRQISDFTNGTSANAQFATGGLDLLATTGQTFTCNRYMLQYIFRSNEINDEKNNDRRYITLTKINYSQTTSSLKGPTTSNARVQAADLSFVYKGFFGVYHKSNDTPPYTSSINNPTPQTSIPAVADGGAGSYASLSGSDMVKLCTHGFDKLSNGGKFPVYPYADGFRIDGTYRLGASKFRKELDVEDFNSTFLRITGWKYGVYHHLPFKTFCHYRRGKFGQFRDMLEQRPYTKIYKIDAKTTEGPINVVFTSGSDDFVTASNQTTLNTTNSGIFDIEAKSGKPFDDSL